MLELIPFLQSDTMEIPNISNSKLNIVYLYGGYFRDSAKLNKFFQYTEFNPEQSFNNDELTEFEWDLNELYLDGDKSFVSILNLAFAYKNYIINILRLNYIAEGRKFAIFLIFQNDDIARSAKIKFWEVRDKISFTQDVISNIEMDSGDQPLYLEII